MGGYYSESDMDRFREDDQAEIERLTAERNETAMLLSLHMKRAEQAEAERDEARHNLGLATASIDRLNENNRALAEDMNGATGTIDRLNSNNLTLCAELAGWKQTARQMEAERDLARAQVAAAYASGWQAGNHPDANQMPADARAALEAYGREKMREATQRASEAALAVLINDPDSPPSLAYRVERAILAAMKGGDDE